MCLFLEVITITCDCIFQSVWGLPIYGYDYGQIHVLCIYSHECASMFYGRWYSMVIKNIDTGAMIPGLTTQLY